MALAKSTYAAIRYGFGFLENQPPPSGAEDLLQNLQLTDQIALELPVKSFATQVQEELYYNDLRRAAKREEPGAAQAYKQLKKAANQEYLGEFLTSILRPMIAEDGFRERLVRFWSDHFSIVAKGKGLRPLTTAYVEEAIRPLIMGDFRDLLRAAVTHPVMLVFLDQVLSLGPNSAVGKRRGRGLNENLAREILELHTLGVGGAYGQTDVREFAELLTGLNYNRKKGFQFRALMAEPGAETVLGKVYGGGRASIDDIYQALDDLADHPETARHLARKLVVHFVSDTPDLALVDHVSAAFTASGGNLLATYTALLDHPKAWQDFGTKAKQPFDFIVSSLRALNVDPQRIQNLKRGEVRLYFSAPMQIMGQPYLTPSGPDGWPEPIEDWITPQGMAARIQWALITTQALAAERDPQDFARTALADAAGKDLSRAVGAAESRLEGMALVLASPQFNRR